MLRSTSVVAREACFRSSAPSTTRYLARRPSTRSGGSITTNYTSSSSSRRLSSTLVVSRRQWNEFLTKGNPKLKPKPTTSSNGKTTDDKPWPRSVILTGYALAATVIPYTVVWICLTNESTRPLVLNACNDTVEQALRNHFGETDYNQISYTDQHEGGGMALPKKFMGEISQTARRQEERIQQAAHQPVQVHIRVVGDASLSDPQIVELPATTLARPQELWKKVPKTGWPENAYLAIDFPVTTKEKESEIVDTMDDDSTTNMVDFGDSTNKATTVDTTEIDPLREEARVYSLWHYQPAAPDAAADSSNQRKQQQNGIMSHDDIQASRLRHHIAVLEEELKNSTVATRPIDDIVEELNSKKSELRRLQWKKWVPWN